MRVDWRSALVVAAVVLAVGGAVCHRPVARYRSRRSAAPCSQPRAFKRHHRTCADAAFAGAGVDLKVGDAARLAIDEARSCISTASRTTARALPARSDVSARADSTSSRVTAARTVVLGRRGLHLRLLRETGSRRVIDTIGPGPGVRDRRVLSAQLSPLQEGAR